MYVLGTATAKFNPSIVWDSLSSDCSYSKILKVASR
jgi:hypothetical protein